MWNKKALTYDRLLLTVGVTKHQVSILLAASDTSLTIGLRSKRIVFYSTKSFII